MGYMFDRMILNILLDKDRRMCYQVLVEFLHFDIGYCNMDRRSDSLNQNIQLDMRKHMNSLLQYMFHCSNMGCYRMDCYKLHKLDPNRIVDISSCIHYHLVVEFLHLDIEYCNMDCKLHKLIQNNLVDMYM
jgi:hypothetical protein